MAKSYPERPRNRHWKLRHLDKESELRPDEAKRQERDYELFLQSLESDPELRSTINLYKGQRVFSLALSLPSLLMSSSKVLSSSAHHNPFKISRSICLDLYLYLSSKSNWAGDWVESSKQLHSFCAGIR